MTDQELRQFVLDYCDGHIYTSEDEGLRDDLRQVSLTFMPISLMKQEMREEVLKDAAIIYGNRRKHHTSGMAMNGWPVFFECAVMGKEDWNRAYNAIMKELKRRSSIEV
jgi:hypothetical protein